MELLNVRLGFACNSSSTHSMIFLPDYKRKGHDDSYHGHYGWDFFTLANPEGKLDYIGTMLYEYLVKKVGTDAALAIVRDWVGDLVEGEESYIDHESHISLPRDFGGKLVSREFIEDWKKFVIQEDVIILGGNDNTLDNHPLDNGPDVSFNLPLPEWGDLVCRKDGPYGVVFNTSSGGKIRFSFDYYTSENLRRMQYRHRQSIALPEKIKPLTPELCDVKLTDYCPYGCEFCYQGSTVAGAHAPMEHISKIAHTLHELKVFEVALGGGEATLHPNFLEILRLFRRLDIVPNFTTRNLAWIRGSDVKEILDLVGAFAFSADSEAEVNRLGVALQYHTGSVTKANVQVVEGVVGTYKLRAILKVAHQFGFPVTILGYKETGRGGEYVSKKEECDWLQVVNELREQNSCPRISIDTVLAERYKIQILESGVPKWMFTTKEGQFSMYIDAPGSKIGPSSFCKEEEYVSYGERDLREKILDNFAKW